MQAPPEFFGLTRVMEPLSFVMGLLGPPLGPTRKAVVAEEAAAEIPVR